MSEEKIYDAIITLETLIDCYKEDGTYYNAQKEWQAIDIFKKLQQENKQLKEQNEKEFADYTKFKQEQYDEYLEKSNKLIKEKQHYKHIIDELEKWLEEEIKSWTEAINEEHDYELVNEFALRIDIFEDVLNKLKELRGKNE